MTTGSSPLRYRDTAVYEFMSNVQEFGFSKYGRGDEYTKYTTLL